MACGMGFVTGRAGIGMLDALRRASTGGLTLACCVAFWVCCVAFWVCGVALVCSVALVCGVACRGDAVAATAGVTVRLAVLAPAMALLNPKLMSLTECRVTAAGGGKSRGCNRANPAAPCTKITSSIRPAWRR